MLVGNGALAAAERPPDRTLEALARAPLGPLPTPRQRGHAVPGAPCTDPRAKSRRHSQTVKQHGHEVERTLVERRTYAAGRDAVTYLEERRCARKTEAMDAVGVREGTEQVLVQVDGGAVQVGQLERPARDATDPTQELTPVRKLPKGRRPTAKREVRVALAWQPGTVDDKVVDVHIAPHKHPEFTGDRMYCAALEAGMGDNTHVHATFDMAR